ncbi:hypothetical protein IE077_004455 [Cardiosporidium cionae]|uniref:Uncharacterized protein n=1 Tax=Cardiosporidium cionae TaxID=476202 RepID=A0ABQ7J9D1_9APIC|nr:hypothetical protein IE077_004455 [Cardiosporidium cionae]|eukprot:KAF8820613.1 hypothetical protein IE077_004455 [Cardiosporidium cionae]
MSLFSLTRRRLSGNHIFLGTYRDFNGWKLNPPAYLRSAILPLGQRESSLPPSKVLRHLRGSGLHGPENSDVLRLTLWNRLKNKRPQREVPTTFEIQEWSKLEVSCVWFTWAFLLFYMSMTSYGSNYAVHHGHMPWLPPRTDGSQGDGPMFWFLE